MNTDYRVARQKFKEAMRPILAHPLWSQVPMSVFPYLDRADHAFDSIDADENVHGRVASALQMITDRGVVGGPEETFLAAARKEFSKENGLFANVIEIAASVADAAFPEKKMYIRRVRERSELVQFIYLAARQNPELLELLCDSAYKPLHASVCNNPHLDKLLAEHCFQDVRKIKSIKVMLAPLERTWSEDCCTAASEALSKQNGFRYLSGAERRTLVREMRERYPGVVSKILYTTEGLRVFYDEDQVITLELFCYTMHAACLGVHA